MGNRTPFSVLQTIWLYLAIKIKRQFGKDVTQVEDAPAKRGREYRRRKWDLTRCGFDGLDICGRRIARCHTGSTRVDRLIQAIGKHERVMKVCFGSLFFLATWYFLSECGSATPMAERSPPVRVELHYETRCPDSIRFITDQLWPTYKSLYASGMLDIRIYPYGNCAQNRTANGTWEFKCQHGKLECDLNQLATCVNYLATKRDVIRYIYCAAVLPDQAGAEKCASKVQLDWGKIKDCADSRLGNALQHQAGLAMERLKPKHTFIPWIVVNGKGGGDVQKSAMKNLKKLVCEEYTGTKPKTCSFKYKLY